MNNTKRTDLQDLTTGSIAKKLILYFLPIAAGTIFQQLYNAVDAFIVSKYVGTEALAAVGGSVSTLTNVIVGFFVALASGATVIIAQLYGAGDDKRLSRASHTAIVFCVACGAFLTLLGVTLARQLLLVMKTPADTLADATSYLRIYFGGSIFTLLFNIGSGILRAVGDSRRPFIFLMVSCVCNIILDLFFVRSMGLGVPGVAIATVISQVLSAVLVLIILSRSKESYAFSFKKLCFDIPLFKRMMFIGVPNGLQSLMYGSSNLLIQSGVNELGTVVVASWALSGKVDGFYWASINAAGIAVMNFAGQNFGAGRNDRVKECGRTGMKLFMGMTIGFSTVILLIAQKVLGIFTDDQAVIETTWIVIKFFVPYYFSWTIIEVLSGLLRGVGDAVTPTVICGIGIAAFRVVWMFTVFRIWYGLTSLCLAYPASWVVTGVTLIIYYRMGKWQRRRMDNEVHIA